MIKNDTPPPFFFPVSAYSYTVKLPWQPCPAELLLPLTAAYSYIDNCIFLSGISVIYCYLFPPTCIYISLTRTSFACSTSVVRMLHTDKAEGSAVDQIGNKPVRFVSCFSKDVNKVDPHHEKIPRGACLEYILLFHSWHSNGNSKTATNVMLILIN